MTPDVQGEAVEEPAANRAYSLTKELILSGEFPPGHLSSEGDIARRLGVSRTPVREAFIRLQAEGLLQLLPRRGVVVAPVPFSEAEDVLDAREAVETAAVNRLYRCPDTPTVSAGVDRLRSILQGQRLSARSRDVAAFTAADDAFHRAIVEAGGNRLLTDFYATLSDRQRRMSVHVLGPTLRRSSAILDEHQELIELIESGNPDIFGTALRRHLNRMYR